MYKADSIIQVSSSKFIHNITWRCSGSCVYIFSEEWLNDDRFSQFEKCVTRVSKPKSEAKDLNSSDDTTI
jgi:hypothetical protein